MKRIICWAFLGLLLAGCAGPRFMGSPIQGIATGDVVIKNNKATRSGFQQTMESWLKNNNYQYVVVPDGSQFELDKLSLEYVGYWGWDLALYMKNATIAAYNKGQRVGMVEFKAPNSLNVNKFGSAEERIGYMMDVLFGKRTIDEANELLKGGPGDGAPVDGRK